MSSLSGSMEETMVERLVENLNCKSCSRKMEPPLFQCSDGHYCCRQCIKKSGSCSQCNTLITQRNHLFETLCFTKKLKCSFADDGCQFEQNAMDVAEHERLCRFSPSRLLEANDSESLLKRTTLIQWMVNELKCHFCSSPMNSPLIQCYKGHHCCTKCVATFSSCPDDQMPARRNHLFEKLCLKINLKCSFAAYGCEFIGNGVDVANHETNCHYFLMKLFANDDIRAELVRYIEDILSMGDTDSKTEVKGQIGTKTCDEGQSLESAFLEELECPVCFRRWSPPVAECIYGHRSCIQCFDLVAHCPICRAPISISTNIFLEKFYSIAQLPCENSGIGCTFRGNVVSLLEHEESCQFRTMSCLLMVNGTCDWQGLKSQIVDHCRTIHSDNISLGSEHKWVLKAFLNYRDIRSSFNLFYVYGVIFRCGWDKCGERNVRFSVNYLVNDNAGHRYTYEMDILMADSDRVGTNVRYVCADIRDGSVSSLETSYIVLSTKLLLDFCDSESCLSYIVKIFDNSVEDVVNNGQN